MDDYFGMMVEFPVVEVTSDFFSAAGTPDNILWLSITPWNISKKKHD